MSLSVNRFFILSSLALRSAGKRVHQKDWPRFYLAVTQGGTRAKMKMPVTGGVTTTT
jgi:hypothetical protein